MIIDARSDLSGDFVADVTIVGAGAVGLALGITLARAGIRVLIVEAGKRSPPANYVALNSGKVAGQPHRGLTNGRMKAVGGTTKLWGGQLIAFGPLDFEGIPAAGTHDWPIAYDDVKSYFDRAFALLGIAKDGYSEDVIWKRTTGSVPQLGENLKPSMSIWMSNPDFSRLFGAELEKSDNICILTDAEAEAFVMDESGTAVTAIRLRGENGPTIPVKRLVLANGTFEISRLLLQAAARDASGPFARLPRLGLGFVDHLHGLAGEIVVKNPRILNTYFDNIYFDGRKYTPKIRSSDRFRKAAGIANCAGTINAAMTPRALLGDATALAKRIVGGEISGIGQLIRDSFVMARIFVPLAWRYVVERRASNLLSKGVFLGLELEQLPTPKSRITLDPAYPPEEAPVLLHWDFDGREIEAAARFCEEIDAQFRAMGIGHVEIDPRIRARDPAFLETCHDSNHHIGGAAMGTSPTDGVVDADGKVFGVENLYVCGAATFPSGSFANPTLTAIALALRLSDHLEATC